MQKARRDFLKTIGAGSALWLSGCSSLDQMIVGDLGGGEQKVLIVGAGLSGLTAAYELKKRKIPFRLLEASSRVGGRVWTVKNINISSQSADLGGEDIELVHTEIQTLAKELGLSLNEINPILGYSWLSKSEDISARDWLKESARLESFFKKLQVEAYGSSVQYLSHKNKTQFPKALSLDLLSVEELLDQSKKDLSAWVKPFVTNLVESEWGGSISQISALHLVHWARQSFSIHRRKYLRIDGGAENMAQSLYDKIAGVIPDRYIKFQHQLKSIERNDKKWTLTFDTPKGRREYSAPAVICTLPVSIYPEISGWDSVPGSDLFINSSAAKKVSSQSKLILSFTERYWKEHSVLAGGGTIISDRPYMNMSHAGSIPSFALGTVHGLLQARLGGVRAENLNPEMVQSVLAELQMMDPKASSYESIYHLQNWKTYPWSKGGRSYAAPGQYSSWDEDKRFEAAEGWVFSGDAHSLRYLGTMNGAVETALMAVDKVVKVL